MELARPSPHACVVLGTDSMLTTNHSPQKTPSGNEGMKQGGPAEKNVRPLVHTARCTFLHTGQTTEQGRREREKEHPGRLGALPVDHNG